MFGLALSMLWVVGSLSSWGMTATEPPPNIILIIADDLAWDDSTPYGHPSVRTPHLQRMAETGMRFDRAMLTISSCSPSRSSIITGRYPHQTDAEQLHYKPSRSASRSTLLGKQVLFFHFRSHRRLFSGKHSHLSVLDRPH